MPNSDEKKRKRVLVVDDETAILRIIDTSLRLMGYDVITAGSGKDALKLCETEKPDIMLLDIFMPGMDGLEVLEILRQKSKMPVIILSANSSSREIALRLGADDFVAKPFTPEQLEKKVSAALEKK
ncbi:MAG: response regulator [Dehalococcoidales bacterium]|nr:response regulator [Dehalococcoidales bacterium]